MNIWFFTLNALIGGGILDTKQVSKRHTTGSYVTYHLRSEEFRHHSDSAMIALEHVLREKQRRVRVFSRCAVWGAWIMCALAGIAWFFSRLVGFLAGSSAVFTVFLYMWTSHAHQTYTARLQAVTTELKNRRVVVPDR